MTRAAAPVAVKLAGIYPPRLTRHLKTGKRGDAHSALMVKNWYAKAYNKSSVDNETAKRPLEEALAIEEAKVRLKRSYLPRLEKVLPETKVARYLQIETKIRALVRYELAAQIPLVY